MHSNIHHAGIFTSYQIVKVVTKIRWKWPGILLQKYKVPSQLLTNHNNRIPCSKQSRVVESLATHWLMKGDFYCLFSAFALASKGNKTITKISIHRRAAELSVFCSRSQQTTYLHCSFMVRLDLSCTLTTTPLWPFGTTLQAVSPA